MSYTDRPPHLCFVNTSTSWGGGEKWHSVAAKLCCERAQVSVITKRESKLAAQLESSSVSLSFFNISNRSLLNPMMIWRLYRYFKSNQFDCVILNLPADVKSAGIAAKLAKVKRVIYRRGMPHPIRNTCLNRFLFSKVITDVIVNSDEIGRSIVEKNPDMIEATKIHTIYNGVNINEYQPNIEGSIQREGDEIILGTTGRCVAQKNQLVLLDVVAELKRRGRNIKLYIAGTGPLEAQLKLKITALGLDNQVHLLGFLSDPKPMLASLDVYLFPSHYEGSANSVIEAMAMAKPSVVFAVSSMPEMIEHGINGQLADYPDVDDFIEKLDELVQNKQKRQAMGIASKQLVEQKFNNKVIFKQIKELLIEQSIASTPQLTLSNVL